MTAARIGMNKVFTGLCFSVNDMPEGSLAEVMHKLKTELETETYKAFAEKIRTNAT
ncbi:MAG: hypothetical protein V2I97_05710 [Desulfococcaceae bacterium]|jgi:hypothetical protein|nr:hypothetical protein [Desulfococcaceae bacterium]